MVANDRSVLERWNALQEMLLERRDAEPEAGRSLVLVFRAGVPIDEIGAQVADLILLDPTDSDHPVAIYRPLPATSVVDLVKRLGDLELLLPRHAHPAWSSESPSPETRAASE